jgi:hypothetical protein
MFMQMRSRRVRTNSRREQYLAERTPEQIQQDLIAAFDHIELLGVKIWILTGVVIAQTGVIAWLANQLFDRLK